MSAATKLMPSSPRMIVRSSRVVQPPVSGVPVAGATVVGDVSLDWVGRGVCVCVCACVYRDVRRQGKGGRGAYMLGLRCRCRC